MANTDQYYSILGVGTAAKLAEIKKAYRKRAKELHPDINTAPDAHEQFVLLNEAYEYLQKAKTGKVYSARRHEYKKPGRAHNSKYQWEKQRERARKRAQHHARMRYEAFTRTDFYKTTVALDTIMDFVLLLSVGFIFIGIPIIAYSVHKTTGLLVAGFMIFVTVGFWAPVLNKAFTTYRLKDLGEALRHLGQLKAVWLISLLALNFALAAHYALSTLLPLSLIIALYTIPALAAYFISKGLWKNIQKGILVFGLIPLMVNLIFVANFYGSSGAYTESYFFRHKKESRRNGGSMKTSMIYLEEEKYQQYVGIRVFTNFQKLEKANSIEYHFEKGLFGVPVMKSYKFIRIQRN